MKKNLKNLLMLAGAAFMTTFCGCSVEEMERILGLDVPKEALFMLSFHREVNYPRGNLKSEMTLIMPHSQRRVVERYPIMSSHYIVDIAAKPVPGRPGFYRLFLRPDQKGRMMWMQMSVLARNEPVAIMLDGIYFGEFKSLTVTEGTEKWVELPLDVDGARAKQIVKYANDNYRFFNGGSREDSRDLFPEE